MITSHWGKREDARLDLVGDGMGARQRQAAVHLDVELHEGVGAGRPVRKS